MRSTSSTNLAAVAADGALAPPPQRRNPYAGTVQWPARLAWVRQRIWSLLFIVMFAAAMYPQLRNLVLGVEVTAAQRGYQVARQAGCFNCHGPDGIGGVKNPGSAYGEVPGFAGGTPMMWVKAEDELREYILSGAPLRKAANPLYQDEMKGQLLVMPAYRGYLSQRQVEDLLVYLRAVSGLIAPADELAARGQELADRYGCFNCHGPMGAGTSKNLGSLKGYIPGWWGNDFRDLVRSDEELRDWIRDGSIDRLREHPIARHFIRGQRVVMPAYRDFMSENDLTAVMRYVHWVNAGNWQHQPMDLEQ